MARCRTASRAVTILVSHLVANVSNGFSIVALRAAVPRRACATETPAIRFSFPQRRAKRNRGAEKRRDEEKERKERRRKKNRSEVAQPLRYRWSSPKRTRLDRGVVTVPRPCQPVRAPSLTPPRQVASVWIFCLLCGRNRLTRRSSPFRYCPETGFRRMDRGQRGATREIFKLRRGPGARRGLRGPAMEKFDDPSSLGKIEVPYRAMVPR